MQFNKLALALNHHQAGQVRLAEQLYEELSQSQPDTAEVWHLWGVLAHQQNQPQLAIERLQRAITLDSSQLVYQVNLGQVYLQLGEHAQAAACFQQILQHQPDNASVHNQLGVVLQQLGQVDLAMFHHQQAIQLWQHVLAKSSNPAAIDNLRQSLAQGCNNLGLVYQTQGQLNEAIRWFETALEHAPHLAQAHFNLGNILSAQGNYAQAIEAFQQALSHQPDYLKAHNNLGIAYQRLGQLSQALNQYQKLLQVANEEPSQPVAEPINPSQINPSVIHALNNMGSVYHALGQFETAISYYQRALTYQPNDVELYNNLGNVWLDYHRFDEAMTCFEQAIAKIYDLANLQPNEWSNLLATEQRLLATSLKNLGAASHKQGDVEAALAHFEQAQTIQPTDLLRLKMALTLPIVYPSIEAMQSWRQRLTTQIETLLDEGIQLNPFDDVIGLPLNFLSAYQGENERELQTKIGQLYLSLPFSPPQSKKPSAHLTNGQTLLEEPFKIGFISAHFRHHTVGKLLQGLIANLNRAQFQVIVFSIGHYQDEIADFIRQSADLYVELSPEITTACQQITDYALDLLFYADIGMEPYSYALALNRLAPVQCVTWGHSVTSGLSTIDYYLSSDLYEITEADDHYQETLVRLAGLNTYYHRPTLPTPTKTRAAFGLLDTPAVYLCPQSVYKYHPAFDELIAGILQRDPTGIVAILAGDHTHWVELLQQRWQATMPQVYHRIQVIPRQNQSDFLSLLTVATVLLDPIHFGGCNSSLEALAFGIPIVTMPTTYLRGRFTAGFYQYIGVTDCIADTPAQYVEIAVQLGTDEAYHAKIRQKILANHACLYEDQSTLQAYEAFFAEAITIERTLTTLQTLIHDSTQLQAQGRLTEALAIWSSLDELQIANCNLQHSTYHLQFAKAYHHLGMLLGELGRLAEAVQTFQKALQFQPDQPQVLNNLGAVLQNQGRLSEAVEAFRRAIALKPDFYGAYSNLLLSLHYLPDISAETLQAEHEQFGVLLVDNASIELETLATPSTLQSDRLRVGYLSPDFRQHPVAHFIRPILEQHDPKQIELFCYSNVAQPDAATTELRQLAHHWREIQTQSDEAVIAQIRADNLDILVDLAGHTAGNRLQVLAHKPAPIQLTYLGYPNITGLSTVDYRLTDAISEGIQNANGKSQFLNSDLQLACLPNGFLCYSPPSNAPKVNELPALQKGYVTFGSFNHLPKINQQVLETWSQILAQLPTARLLLKTIPLSDAGTKTLFEQRLVQAGLPLDRVDLVGYVSAQAEHLAMYHQVDIALDTFPYNGTTTTCEALWMGVPVVTLQGERHAGRVGSSLLSSVGQVGWIAETINTYVTLAINLSRNLEQLATLRTTLRSQVAESSLCDGVGFTRTLEHLYRKLKDKG